ncbi:MAG TPA: chorismate synthase [Bacteroidales bacterium]|nr:chorismate synthase [Bacteroidales bacterium]
MSGNTLGKIFSFTSFGESHGYAVGGVLDGFPAGVDIDLEYIQNELDKRKPGNSSPASARNESDKIQIVSGVFEGKSLGTPIAFFIFNENQKPEDYYALKDVFRPSHADFTYYHKYSHVDYRGGGRASARETAARVAAGAFAKIFLNSVGVDITAFTIQVGKIKMTKIAENIDKTTIDQSILKCPDPDISEKMMQQLEELKESGDTTGGVVECRITGCPSGLGEPVFDKLSADLAKAMMSINAAKGFEIGSGFDAASMTGSAHNDKISKEKNGKIEFLTNHAGGILGGISNGDTIWFRVAFKPVPSIKKAQLTIDYHGNKKEISISGRHDVCVIPRVVPVVEAMAALVIADHFLRNIHVHHFVNKIHPKI